MYRGLSFWPCKALCWQKMFSTKLVLIRQGRIDVEGCSRKVSRHTSWNPITIDCKSNRVLSDIIIFFLSDTVAGALCDSSCQSVNHPRRASISFKRSSLMSLIGRKEWKISIILLVFSRKSIVALYSFCFSAGRTFGNSKRLKRF